MFELNAEGEKIMTEEILKNVIQTMRQRETIKRITQEKDVWMAYKEEKNALSKSLEQLKQNIGKRNSISEIFYMIDKNNAVEIAVILLMMELDDIDVMTLKDAEEFIEILKCDVEGEFKEIAVRFAYFLDFQIFSYCTERERIKNILL